MRRNARPLCEVVVAAQGADSTVRIHRRRSGQMRCVVAVRVVRDMAQSPPTGHLNPGWVEWLMGFPAGWLDTSDRWHGAPSVDAADPPAHDGVHPGKKTGRR